MSRPKKKPAEFLSTCNVDITEMKKRKVMWDWLMRAFWSYDVVRNHESTKPVREHNRRIKNDMDIFDEDELLEWREAESKLNFEKQEIMEFMKTITLPPRQKEVIVRHCQKFESWNRIARDWNVRRDTVIQTAVEATKQICKQL